LRVLQSRTGETSSEGEETMMAIAHPGISPPLSKNKAAPPKPCWDGARPTASSILRLYVCRKASLGYRVQGSCVGAILTRTL